MALIQGRCKRGAKLRTVSRVKAARHFFIVPTLCSRRLKRIYFDGGGRAGIRFEICSTLDPARISPALAKQKPKPSKPFRPFVSINIRRLFHDLQHDGAICRSVAESVYRQRGRILPSDFHGVVSKIFIQLSNECFRDRTSKIQAASKMRKE